jgi:excisionase family DNA binding protein
MTGTPEPERLLTTAEAARMFGVHPATVRNWAQAGQLASIRTPGGRPRYREAEVLALLDQR